MIKLLRISNLLFGVFLAGLVLGLDPSVALALENGVQIPNQTGVISRLPQNPKYQWVKFQYGPDQFSAVQTAVRAAKGAGYKVMVSVAKNHTGFALPAEEPTGDDVCPAGSTGGYADYRNFMESTAKNLGSQVDAYEIGNEPNLAGEWDGKWGTYSPIKFAKLVECGAKGIKAGNPNAKVISGAFSPKNGSEADINDLGLMLLTLDMSQIDYVGLHLYANVNVAPTVNNDPVAYLRRLVELIGERPSWVTEFGWQRCDAKISLATQKQYISQTIELIGQQLPSVAGVVIWNWGYGQLPESSQEFKCYDIEGETVKKAQTQVQPATDVAGQPSIETSLENGVLGIKYTGKSQGSECPEPNPTPIGGIGANNQLTAPTFANDGSIARAYSKTQFPESVQESIKSQSVDDDQRRAGVSENFVDQIGRAACQFFGIFCAPKVEIGTEGKQFAKQSQSLAMSQTPPDFRYQPAQNDCNIYDLENQTGNEEINIIQGMWGYSVSNDQAKLGDWESRVQECIKQLNLTLGRGQMPEDRRVCEQELTIQQMKQGNYPPGVDPFPESSTKQ